MGGMDLLGSSVSPRKGLGDEFILQGLGYHLQITETK